MKTMSRMAAALAAATVLCISPALADDGGGDKPSAAEKSGARERQQDRMKRCNAEAGAKSLKGDDRRAFMSGCLKG